MVLVGLVYAAAYRCPFANVFRVFFVMLYKEHALVCANDDGPYGFAHAYIAARDFNAVAMVPSSR